MLLREFLDVNREEILARSRLRVAARNYPHVTDVELRRGLPIFLDQLGEALRKATSQEAVDHADIASTALQHGDDLFHQGLTVAQVVHDYGDLCQVITGLAVDRKAPIDADDFRTLNLCLDDAIAVAVTEWARLRERAITHEGTERLGVLAHEMRNLLSSALLSFESIRTGVVAPGGSTSAMVQRSLMALLALVDRSMADVRLEAGIQNLERVAVWEIIGEVEVGAAITAKERGLSLVVDSVDPNLVVRADRQILAAAVANLLHNALKFTGQRTTVKLRASATATRVLIEVEDECGGLPPGRTESLLEPFTQQGRDRTGLGLGLSICSKAVKAIDGELRIQDLPGKGCIFTIDLPKQPPPPTSIHAHQRKTSDGQTGSGGQLAGAVASLARARRNWSSG
jgi:signal transduction histidine kinase